jgi:hypothetical protein
LLPLPIPTLNALMRRTFHGFLSKNYAVRPGSKKPGRVGENC